MGIVNLLKGSWDGKVGQLVGSKWKDKATLRTYAKPTYTNTPEQQVIRTGFAQVTEFLSLFSEPLRNLTALDTKSMSLRNALMKLNKAQITAGELTPSGILLSRGGLPLPTNVSVSIEADTGELTASWVTAIGATVSQKARVVFVAVNNAEKKSLVGSALNSAQAITIPGSGATTSAWDSYYYLLDYRGSSRVGSTSLYKSIAPS
jgi:hypothetical protein